MQHPDERYYFLAEKWLNGTITEEERQEFSAWYNAGQDNPLDIPAHFAASEEALRRRILQKINAGKDTKAEPGRLWKSPMIKMAAASVAAISFGIALLYFTTHSGRKEAPAAPLATTGTAVMRPGANRAVLQLGDGSSVVLDTASKGVIARDHGARAIKLEDGRLAYEASKEKPAGTVYNVLSTPRGSTYSIVLEDGTRVWLNAASSLRFPTAFGGKERLVELSGEGYFEVARNTRPFLVRTGNGSEIEVLGTHFNIMSYADEASERTTLLEGVVRVRDSEASVVLKPGQQSLLSRGPSAQPLHVVRNADVDEAVAWRKDLFQFQQADVRTIMRQLSRWYDIDVSYAEEVQGHFSGTIPRTATLEKALQLLELTGSVHFTLAGHRVTVHE